MHPPFNCLNFFFSTTLDFFWEGPIIGDFLCIDGRGVFLLIIIPSSSASLGYATSGQGC